MRGGWLLILGFILLNSTLCLAAAIDWKGGTSTDWAVAANWSSNTVPTSTDSVRIGVVSFTNALTITATTTIASLTLGATGPITLTVNSGVVLTVNTYIKQMHSSGNANITTYINGQIVGGILGGTIICKGSFYVGDATKPTAPFLGIINGNLTNLTTINIAIKSFFITQNIFLNTTSATSVVSLATTSNVNNAYLNILNGAINTNTIITNNYNYVNIAAFSGYSAVVNKAQIIVNPVIGTTSTSSQILTLTGSPAININSDGNGAGFLDFNGGGSGTSTVIYNGTGQTVYTATTGLDNSPATYQNLSFTGTGSKTIQAGTLTISGNWTSAGGKVDAVSNTPTTVFQGSTQTLADTASNSGKGVVFYNATFQGGNTKTLSLGNFSIAATGLLSLSSSSTLNANGNLTLFSDSTSSASVGIIPIGCSIIGNVNVQRFIKGSPTDLSKRGYRLITSAVYTGTVTGAKIFDLNYLLNNCYISGAAGGGFNTTGTNPSLYIYREDIAANNNGFTAGNFKGIAKINNPNAYDIGTQQYLTTANVADTTVNLPAGNGVLFFFRGNLSDNSSQSGSKTVQPFDYPESVVFTQKGTLNTGTINVKLWFRQDNLLSFTNTSSQNTTVRGFCLVGNPYASTINWEKFNRNGSNSSIYGANFPAPSSSSSSTIWFYNPTNKQYETYMQKESALTTTADTTTNISPGIAIGSASNMIASGQGFFIRATAANQSLTFSEAAKTTAQPTASNFIKLLAVTMPNQATNAAASVSTASPLLRVQLFQDTINTDEIAVVLNASASAKFVENEDAEDIGGNGAAVSLSALTSDGVLAAIDQIPTPQKTSGVVDLVVNATTSGSFNLKLTQQTNLPTGTQVWLKDNFKKDSVDFIHYTNYSFNIDNSVPATFANGRFQLIISGDGGSPLRLVSFNAAQVANTKQVKTAWTVANEYTTTAFIVERSNDNGVTFTSIGSVQSTGAGNYSLTDFAAQNGLNLYRVKVTDLNNNITYTSNVFVNITDNPTGIIASSISVYPNPAISTVNLKMNPIDGTGATYSILLMNSTGSLLKTITSTQPYWQENVSNLIPGLYVMKVINNKDQSLVGTGKFLKM